MYSLAAEPRAAVSLWPGLLTHAQLYHRINGITYLTFGKVRGVYIPTGEQVIYYDMPNEYNEVESIQVGPDGDRAVDIWRLRLKPNSTDFVRLTRFDDVVGYKASNPVLSPHGQIVRLSK